MSHTLISCHSFDMSEERKQQNLIAIKKVAQSKLTNFFKTDSENGNRSNDKYN